MAIPKQTVQFFFGTPEQDSSAKAAKISDLTTAKNITQLHSGEYEKRGGFAKRLMSYGGAIVEPTSITSPDGDHYVIHCSDGSAFVKTGEFDEIGRQAHKNQGAATRWLAKTSMRFPAVEEGSQTAPMCKRSGDFFVFLVDESHIRVARQSLDGSSLVDESGIVPVNGPAGDGPYPSTHIKSFAVVNTDLFDEDHLWVFWVDWTTNEDEQQNRDGVWAMKFDKSDLSSYSSMCISSGGVSNLCLSSISASVVGNGRLVVAQVGNIAKPTQAFTGFRKACSSVDWRAQHFYVDTNGSKSETGYLTGTSSLVDYNWCASGCCLLTVKGVSSFHSGSFFYAAWVNSTTTSDRWELKVFEIPENFDEQGNQQNGTAHTVWSVDTSMISSIGHGRAMGSVTGYETSSGAFIVAQMRHYLGVRLVDPDGDYTCDRLYTVGFDWQMSSMQSPTWTARGAWLAHGWFSLNDSVGTRCVITGYEDTDAIQMPYHIRLVETGQIISQFAYGRGAHAGGTSTKRTQVEQHCSDMNQPVIQSAMRKTSHDEIALATMSENTARSVDIVSVELSSPIYQRPTTFGGLAIAPGPIPTMANGWQRVTECGPLVAPSKFLTCVGEGNT